MIFTSLQFLVFFLTLLALMVVIRGDRQRMYLLLVASYVFYGAWSAHYLLLIAICSLWGWGFGLLMDRSVNQARKRLYMSVSLTLCLLMLGYYKYANFFAQSIAAVLEVEWRHADILLPVGISFFTFQTMSYVIDLYRGKIEVCRSMPRFFLFVAFFPQLVAGPIVRATEFLPQLEKHIKLTRGNMIVGAQLFLGGAIQKVLIADNLSLFVDPVFSDPGLYSPGTLWLALISYSIQIFCDFSGYSLMAIGIARILGFTLPENFRMPYLSMSITEFWRRWHITLSFWLRDYLYISLGGNRQGRLRTEINLMITMLLGGLWHGASWNFVLWGGMHGAGLVVHKLWSRWDHPCKQGWIYSALAWALTCLFVILLWVPFRSPDFASTLTFYQGLLPGLSGIEWPHTGSLIVLTGVMIWHLMYAVDFRWLREFPAHDPFPTRNLYPIVLALMLVLMFAPLNTSPFIYFQF